MQSVQNYCFSQSNMQICDVLVAVVVRKLPNRQFKELRRQLQQKIHIKIELCVT